MLRTLRLNRLGSLSRAFGTIPLAGRIVGAVVIVAVISASLTGFVAYRVADGNGYDRGFEVGKTQGFDSGKQDGLAASEAKRREGFDAGYGAGKHNGYSDGYNQANQETLKTLEARLPPLLDLAFLAGKAAGSSRSAPTYTTVDVGGVDFGSIHCESRVNSLIGKVETDCR